MISLKPSHGRPLIAVLSLVVMIAVACSSSSESAATTPNGPESAATTATAPADGTSAPASSVKQEPTDAKGGIPSQPATNRIALVSADGSVYTIDPDGSDRQRLTVGDPAIPGAALSAFYGWPVWSPDGRHLLISAFTPDISGGFETSLLRASATRPRALPELLYRDVPGTNGIGGIPHFPVWHPNGGSVALIANVGDGLSTFLIDVEDGLGPTVSNGAPVYLDWSANGSHMLVHTAERLVLHSFGPDGMRTGSERIGIGSISYRVPKFAPNSDRFAYIDLLDGQRTLLVRTPGGTSPTQARLARANNAFAWSPDGARLAYGDGSRAGFYESLRIIDPDGDETGDIVVDAPILAFWWSPDGESILLAMPGGEPENAALAVVDTGSGEVNFLGLIEPSAEMGFVIGFFDQYSADLQLWSPDSSRFVFSGILKEGLTDEEAGTPVQLGDPESSVWVIDPSGFDSPISLGVGGFGAWSPD